MGFSTFLKSIPKRIGRLFRHAPKVGVPAARGKAREKRRNRPSKSSLNELSGIDTRLFPSPEGALPAPAREVVSHFEAISEFSGVQLSPHTQKAYRRDLRDFFAYLKTHGLLEGWNSQLSPVHIAEYRSYLVSKGLAKPSVTRKLAVLKSFFRWARAREWIDFNPAELVRGFPQTQESKTGFLVDAEIDQLLRYLDFLPRERLFYDLARVTLQTLLMLGLRRGEAARIRLGDLSFQEDRWLLRVKGKGDRDRLLPLPQRLLSTWCEWLLRVGEDAPKKVSPAEAPGEWLRYFARYADRPLLISSRAKNFETPLSEAEIGHIVRKFGRKAGLAQRLSPHMLRATAITHALDQGASDRSVQQMAGWTSPLMITRYDKRRKDPRFSAVHHLKFAQVPKPAPLLRAQVASADKDSTVQPKTPPDLSH